MPRTRLNPALLTLTASAWLLHAAPSRAQQATTPMGTVAVREAKVSGGLEVSGDKATLVSNAAITAGPRTASIDLTRGGAVFVCATSQFHLLRSGPELSLLFGLDRGALEIHSLAQPQDVILTPDLRFSPVTSGMLNLRIRVTPNGDTCVENAGAGAPVLAAADAFSSAGYRILPGQHVLFEHGSLAEVVDREKSPCGCPAPPSSPLQIAHGPGGPVSPEAAAAEHPFPEAASQGLAPEPTTLPGNVSPPGQVGEQVASTIRYGGTEPAAAGPGDPAGANASTSGNSASGSGNGPATPPPSPPGAHDIGHAVKHFFNRIFHPHAKN